MRVSTVNTRTHVGAATAPYSHSVHIYIQSNTNTPHHLKQVQELEQQLAASWTEGTAAGAPLQHMTGALVCLCGCDIAVESYDVVSVLVPHRAAHTFRAQLLGFCVSLVAPS